MNGVQLDGLRHLVTQMFGPSLELTVNYFIKIKEKI